MGRAMDSYMMAQTDGLVVRKGKMKMRRVFLIVATAWLFHANAARMEEMPVKSAAVDNLPLARADSTKAEIRWRGGNLTAVAGKAVRFRFKLHCGMFYSFWVSKDASGKSGGYLAAGGPAYTGLRDL